jgi:hypothetical protein
MIERAFLSVDHDKEHLTAYQDLLIIMLPNDSLNSLCTRHNRSLAHQRRSRSKSHSHSLPDWVENCRTDAMLFLETQKGCEMMPFRCPHFLKTIGRRRVRYLRGKTRSETWTDFDLLSRLLVTLDLGDKLGSLIDPVCRSLSDMIYPDRLLQQLPLLRSQVIGRCSRCFDRALLDYRGFRWSSLSRSGHPIDIGSGRS